MAVETRPLRAVAHAGMFAFGIAMALIGAVMPSVSLRLSLSIADIGTLMLVMNAAMLGTSLLLGLAMDRFGLKPPLAAGAGLVAVALVAIATASSLSSLFPAVACLGLGGGALNGGTNTLVADLHEDPRQKAAALNVLGVFFGFGALCLPFGVGALMSRLGVEGVLFGAAGLCAITGLAALVLRFPAPKHAQGWPLAEMPRFARLPLVQALCILLFFESASEFVLAGYLTTFLTRTMGVAIEGASYLLAAYWAAMMLSRLALSQLLLRATPSALLLGGALLAAAGTLAIGTAHNMSMAAAAIVLTGAALAGVFPIALGIAGTAYRERSGTVFGVLFTCALTGGMTMPWLAGRLAEAAGLRWVFGLVAANFLMVAVASDWVRRSRVAT